MTEEHQRASNADGSELCQVCHQRKLLRELLPASMLHEGIGELARRTVPDWRSDGYICFDCMNHLRSEYIEQLLHKDLGELDELEKEVVQSLADNEVVSENLNEQYEQQLTLGDRIADKVAEFGGSWAFIGWFGLFMRDQHLRFVLAALRPLSLHPVEPDAFVARGHTGADQHDESEPPGGP